MYVWFYIFLRSIFLFCMSSTIYSLASLFLFLIWNLSHFCLSCLSHNSSSLVISLTLLQDLIFLFPVVNHLPQRFAGVRLEGVRPGAAEHIFEYKYDESNRNYGHSKQHCDCQLRRSACPLPHLDPRKSHLHYVTNRHMPLSTNQR